MEFTHNKNQIALYTEDGKLLAEITFPNINDKTVDINHTFVDQSLRGQGIAYAVKWFEKHPEHGNLLNQAG